MGKLSMIKKTPAVIAGLCLGFSTLLTAINSLLRYGFSNSIAWTEELSTLLIVMLVFIILVSLEADNDQLSIGIIDSFLIDKPVIKRILRAFRWALTIGVYFLLVNAGLAIIKQNYEIKSVTSVLQFPQYLLFAIVALCMVLTIIISIVKLVRDKGDD